MLKKTELLPTNLENFNDKINDIYGLLEIGRYLMNKEREEGILDYSDFRAFRIADAGIVFAVSAFEAYVRDSIIGYFNYPIKKIERKIYLKKFNYQNLDEVFKNLPKLFQTNTTSFNTIITGEDFVIVRILFILRHLIVHYGRKITPEFKHNLDFYYNKLNIEYEHVVGGIPLHEPSQIILFLEPLKKTVIEIDTIIQKNIDEIKAIKLRKEYEFDNQDILGILFR